MQNDMLALLAAVLSGQGMSPARPAAQPMAQPQPQMQPMTIPAQPTMAKGMQTGPMIPMAASEQQTHGNDNGGITPGVEPGMDDGGGKGGKGGNGKGGNNNDRLSDFEMQMRRIGNKGPRAYTPDIKKNLGFKEPTIGYGKADPSSFRTGMANSLASILTGTQPTTY